MTLTDTIAKVLEAHPKASRQTVGALYVCECGQPWSRAHLAQVLSEAVQSNLERVLLEHRWQPEGHHVCSCGEMETSTGNDYLQYLVHVFDALASHSSSEPAAPASPEYCSQCHKLIPLPDVAYGINPDALCTCSNTRRVESTPVSDATTHLQPTYFVRHPDGTSTVADPQPTLYAAEREAAAVAAAYQKAADIVESYSGYSDENTGSQMLCQQLTRAAAKEILALADSAPKDAPSSLPPITMCPRCEGSGVYNFKQCSLCDGSGRIGPEGTAFRPSAESERLRGEAE